MKYGLEIQQNLFGNYNMTPFYLKVMKFLYSKFTGNKSSLTFNINNAQEASNIIANYLKKDSPCMIARFGSTELTCFNNYRSIFKEKHSIIKYIKGEESYWEWNDNIINQMTEWSGFFPNTKENIIDFCTQFEKDISYLDLLGSWIPGEIEVKDLIKEVQTTPLRYLEPFYCPEPWTRELEHKKVLVVHPFASQIEEQFKNRDKLFNNPYILPDFKLSTIQAIQSLGGHPDGNFKSWFEALEWMKSEIDSYDYDICLIGCGAYGFALAAHVKRNGKKAIHLGGALQLLFGIIGNRWENPNYGVKEWGIPVKFYSNMINKYWTRPTNKTKPINASQIENSCYW